MWSKFRPLLYCDDSYFAKFLGQQRMRILLSWSRRKQKWGKAKRPKHPDRVSSFKKNNQYSLWAKRVGFFWRRFYGYEPLRCAAEGGCKGNNTVLEGARVCAPFPPAFEADGYMKASRAFSFVTMCLGCVSLVMSWFSTCLEFKVKAWRGLSIILLFTTASQGLVFLIFRTDLCTTSRNPLESTLPISAHCSVSVDGVIAACAGVCWFVAAAGACLMARKVGRTKANSL